jgi:hypothetical protein
MKYLFFDIECANCDLGKGKICSFGYVLTDESFCVLEKEDMLINPDAPFHLTGRRDKRDIKLGYPEERFLSSPKFPAFYDRIFSLIGDEETLTLGYAVINDVNFLIADCERYNFSIPDFDYYDVQLIYADFMGVKGVVSLERASGEFGAVTKEEHISLDDALDTMRIAEGISKKLEIPFKSVLELSYRSKGRLQNGEKSAMATTPRKKAYDEAKKRIFEENPTANSETLKAREQSFNIHSGERRLLHNFESGVNSSSTIGELLKGLKIEV